MMGYEMDIKSFIVESHNKNKVEIKLVGGNIFVCVKAKGNFVETAFIFAKTIDDLIVKQPVLTYQQLLERRPSIEIISGFAAKKEVKYALYLSFDQKIARVLNYIDGQFAAAGDGKIVLAGQQGDIGIRLIAMTTHLLSNSFETELLVE
jgi:hypothetical protein